MGPGLDPGNGNGNGHGHGQAEFLQLDLADPRGAKKAAEAFAEREGRLDILGASRSTCFFRFFLETRFLEAERYGRELIYVLCVCLVNNAAL